MDRKHRYLAALPLCRCEQAIARDAVLASWLHVNQLPRLRDCALRSGTHH